jgi:TPR repeat protein
MTEKHSFSIAALQQKANNDDAQAQFELALCYVNGKDVEQNTELAFSWHRKAAEHGHVNAQFALGLYYLLGKDQLQHTQELVNLINKRIFGQASGENIDPAFDLAVGQAMAINLSGADDDLAYTWLKKAAEQNHAEANYWLGQCYRKGIGTVQNGDLAFGCFRIAGELDCAESYYWLARCYFDGQGVEQNHELALKWIRKSVKHTDVDPEIFLLLGNLYAQGKGVEQSDEKAFELYKQAAEKDVVEAQYLLANCYYHGQGVEKNNNQAYEYYHKAALADHVLAKNRLSEMYFCTGSTIIFRKEIAEGYDYNQAFEFFTESIELGHTETYDELGKYYCSFDYNESYKLAIDWYEKAAKQGNVTAGNWLAKICYYYGGLYEIGYGVEIDKVHAFELFLKAAEYGSIEAKFQLSIALLGQAENDKETGVIVFAGFKMVAEQSENSDTKKMANSLLGHCYAKGIGTEQNLKLAEHHWQLGSDPKDWGDLDFIWLPPNSQLAKEMLDISLGVHFKNKDLDSAKDLINQAFEDAKGIEKGFKKVSFLAIEQAEQLIIKNQELEEKNKELNNLVAMFAHNFLGTLQCIRSNAEHDNNPNVHLKTVKMMGGALTAFSILSADDDKLVERLKQDNTGETNLQQNLANNLALAISQLLAKTNKDKIVNLYLNHLRKTQQIEAEITSEELRANREYRKKWQALQHQWEDEFNALFSENAELPLLQKWITDNFFPIEITGFGSHNISFKEFGITDSIFLTVFMEIFVNAFKYIDVNASAPLTLKFCEEDRHYKLICENPSLQETGRGTHKGMDFLKTIAKKLDGQFITESTENSFKATFSIPIELLN